MKKFILPVILLLTAALFLSPKANAQTRQECEKTRDRASYNCLLGFGKCYSPCVAETKDNMGCRNSCKQAEDVCDKEVNADFQDCKEAIKKVNEEVIKQTPIPETQKNTDCHGVFTEESNTCLKESSKCINSCVDKGTAVMSLKVDGAKVSMECQRAICKPDSKACDDKAMANFRACQDTKKTDNKPKTTKIQKQETKWLEFLGINPYQTWLRLQEIAEVTEFYASGELEESLEGGFLNLFGRKSTVQKDQEAAKRQEAAYEAAFGKDWREQIQQISQPKIDAKIETDAWSVAVPKDESVIDVPRSDTKRYSWDENSGVVIKSNDWEEIKFKEPVKVGGLTSHTLELGEGEVEVKVRNNKPAENQFGVDAGWLGVTVSRTHFSVFKDPNGKLAIVSVYEGEVEVKTKDGKTVKVRPDGDKPGILGVSQKLSTIKLAIISSVFLGIIGGMVYILKRR